MDDSLLSELDSHYNVEVYSDSILFSYRFDSDIRLERWKKKMESLFQPSFPTSYITIYNGFLNNTFSSVQVSVLKEELEKEEYQRKVIELLNQFCDKLDEWYKIKNMLNEK